MNSNLLKNKKILLFATHSFGYEDEIKSKMEDMGATVDYFDERPSNTFFAKALIRINRNLVSLQIESYYKNICKQVQAQNYDYIIFIKGESVSKATLQRLKLEHPHAKMILYLWDSVRNNKNALNILNHFDKILSFDKDDVQKYGFIFRPLFYIEEYRQIADKTTFVYDTLFVGTVHSDRYAFVKTIHQQLNTFGKKMYFYFFFRSIVLYYKKKLFDITYKEANVSDFNFVPVGKTELLTLIAKSACIIDIQHPKQTGLTMRTIEALGACRKLITTNEFIKTYDFYCPDNILIVDRKRPVVNIDFLNTSYQKLDDNIYNSYSLESWINDIVI
jgi:hypothetical protein